MLGPCFFKKGRSRGTSHDHGLTVAITMARGDPTVWPWQPISAVLARFCGQRTPWVARGDPLFSCAHEEVPVFVPVHECTRLFYPDKVSF